MPFPWADLNAPIANGSDRHGDAVSIRVQRIFATPGVYSSDSVRYAPTRAGMAGLRHKLRHKKSRGRRRLPLHLLHRPARVEDGHRLSRGILDVFCSCPDGTPRRSGDAATMRGAM